MPLIILESHGALPLSTKCTLSLDWFTYSLGIVAMNIQSGQSFLPYLHMTRSQFYSEQTSAAHLAWSWIKSSTSIWFMLGSYWSWSYPQESMSWCLYIKVICQSDMNHSFCFSLIVFFLKMVRGRGMGWYHKVPAANSFPHFSFCCNFRMDGTRTEPNSFS